MYNITSSTYLPSIPLQVSLLLGFGIGGTTFKKCGAPKIATNMIVYNYNNCFFWRISIDRCFFFRHKTRGSTMELCLLASPHCLRIFSLTSDGTTKSPKSTKGRSVHVPQLPSSRRESKSCPGDGAITARKGVMFMEM